VLEKVSADEFAVMQTLASRVRGELAAAGLPVPVPGPPPERAGGAEVTVDDGRLSDRPLLRHESGRHLSPRKLLCP
jgi:hypothetical protein